VHQLGALSFLFGAVASRKNLSVNVELMIDASLKRWYAAVWEFAINGSMSKRGFCKAMSEGYGLSRITNGLDKHFKITGTSFKPTHLADIRIQ
jgi:hypothetical protein